MSGPSQTPRGAIAITTASSVVWKTTRGEMVGNHSPSPGEVLVRSSTPTHGHSEMDSGGIRQMSDAPQEWLRDPHFSNISYDDAGSLVPWYNETKMAPGNGVDTGMFITSAD